MIGYHGTKEEDAKEILQCGFDIKKCHPASIWGQGFYFGWPELACNYGPMVLKVAIDDTDFLRVRGFAGGAEVENDEYGKHKHAYDAIFNCEPDYFGDRMYCLFKRNPNTSIMKRITPGIVNKLSEGSEIVVYDMDRVHYKDACKCEWSKPKDMHKDLVVRCKAAKKWLEER